MITGSVTNKNRIFHHVGENAGVEEAQKDIVYIIFARTCLIIKEGNGKQEDRVQCMHKSI